MYVSFSLTCTIRLGWCAICYQTLRFTTWQVSKCLFNFKGFLCFMWEGVYISPQTALHRGVQYTSCPADPPTPVFWHMSRNLVCPETFRLTTAAFTCLVSFQVAIKWVKDGQLLLTCLPSLPLTRSSWQSFVSDYQLSPPRSLPLWIYITSASNTVTMTAYHAKMSGFSWGASVHHLAAQSLHGTFSTWQLF